MSDVRPAKASDLCALLHLLEQVNAVHRFGRPDLFKKATKYGERELLSILADPNTPVFVFEKDGAVLGHAFCVVQNVQNDRLLCDRKTLYIDDICVDERARNCGVGRALYEYVLHFAKEIGCYNLTLNVWSCNPGALAFYERMGLVPQKIGLERIL